MRILEFCCCIILCFRLANSFKQRCAIPFGISEMTWKLSKKNEDAEAFKTGRHTYAAWESGTGRSPPPVYKDDYKGEENEEGDDDFGRENPVQSWMKKVYDTVFFSGLGPPPAKRQDRSSSRVNDDLKTDRIRPSPFFTPSEQWGQEFILRNDEQQQQSRTRSSQPRKSKQSSNKSSTDNDLKQSTSTMVKSKTDKSTLSIKEIKEYVNNLDRKISELMERIEINDVTIIAKNQMNSQDLSLRNLINEQNALKEELEALEIEYVIWRTKLDSLA
eukprot:gene1848-3588_t